MNYGGQPLLSRSTIAAGRTALVLSVSVIAVHFFGVDIESLRVAGVPFTQEQANNISLVALIFVWLGLLANWLFDLEGLGKWSAIQIPKGSETLMGGGGRQIPQISFVIGHLLRLKSDSKHEDMQQSIQQVIDSLSQLELSRWRYNLVAQLYVIGWGFIFPTLLSTLAAYVVWIG